MEEQFSRVQLLAEMLKALVPLTMKWTVWVRLLSGVLLLVLYLTWQCSEKMVQFCLRSLYVAVMLFCSLLSQQSVPFDSMTVNPVFGRPVG